MSAADRAREAAQRASSTLTKTAGQAAAKASEVLGKAAGKATTGRTGKFVLDRDGAGKYRFTLHASNGQPIAVSESYESKSAALNGIASVRRNAPGATLVDEVTS